MKNALSKISAKKGKDKTSVEPIHPEYYGKDVFRSDVPAPAQFKPLSPELIERIRAREARKMAQCGLPPKQKNPHRWHDGITEENSTLYPWNHERITIAAIPYMLTTLFAVTVVLFILACCFVLFYKYTRFPYGPFQKPYWVYCAAGLVSLIAFQTYILILSLRRLEFNRKSGMVHFPAGATAFKACRLESYWGANTTLPNAVING